MKYKIIRDNYLRIDDQVNEHLATGWELHGFPYAMGSIIMQAMVQKTNNEKAAAGTEKQSKNKANGQG